MQYERYRFYDGGVEVMIPSCLKESTSQFAIQNCFVSEDKKMIVNIARGKDGFVQEQLEMRMDEYCKEVAEGVSKFECLKTQKRQFLDDSFVDVRYLSNMMGYQFYNAFVLGIYGGRELIVTMQCVQNATTEDERIFDFIADSIRILKREQSA